MPEDMPEDMPDRMPEDMSEYMPEDMPVRMPDRMPEDMSDRMPQDLSVRKCINVMVGITRSKVIFYYSFCTHASVAIGLGIAVVRPSSDIFGGLQMTRRRKTPWLSS